MDLAVSSGSTTFCSSRKLYNFCGSAYCFIIFICKYRTDDKNYLVRFWWQETQLMRTQGRVWRMVSEWRGELGPGHRLSSYWLAGLTRILQNLPSLGDINGVKCPFQTSRRSTSVRENLLKKFREEIYSFMPDLKWSKERQEYKKEKKGLQPNKKLSPLTLQAKNAL